MPFKNRTDAGRQLAEQLIDLPLIRPIVMALPRGGVPVALEVAHALRAPLDVLIVRKIGAPAHPEYGIGAVAEGGLSWIDSQAVYRIGATTGEIEKIAEAEAREVERRIRLYRGGRGLPSLRGRSVIVVDDGLATGVTARVACRLARERGAAHVILAAPACSSDSASQLRSEVDELICLEESGRFFAVGRFYDDFAQLSDEEVVTTLMQVRFWEGLAMPSAAKGVVIFAHGSGSGRLSPRNQYVSRSLNESGFGTLVADLLTEEESLDRTKIFDIPLLAERLVAMTRWVQALPEAQGLPISYFGASTGAGAALWAAGELGSEISAVVSRGGRPDLALPRLKQVKASTLLIVGGHDQPIIEVNKEALRHLSTGNLVVIPGASHLFKEPGTLEAVARHTISWLGRYLDGRRLEAA